MKTITAFAQLRELQKAAIVKFEGKIIDSYLDGTDMVLIYFLNGFFVEYIMKEDDSVEIIPFKRGYKLPAHVETGIGFLNLNVYGLTA